MEALFIRWNGKPRDAQFPNPFPNADEPVAQGFPDFDGSEQIKTLLGWNPNHRMAFFSDGSLTTNAAKCEGEFVHVTQVVDEQQVSEQQVNEQQVTMKIDDYLKFVNKNHLKIKKVTKRNWKTGDSIVTRAWTDDEAFYVPLVWKDSELQSWGERELNRVPAQDKTKWQAAPETNDAANEWSRRRLGPTNIAQFSTHDGLHTVTGQPKTFVSGWGETEAAQFTRVTEFLTMNPEWRIVNVDDHKTYHLVHFSQFIGPVANVSQTPETSSSSTYLRPRGTLPPLRLRLKF